MGVNQLTAQAKTHPRTYLYKSLAGPASEFPSFTPPSLEDSAMHSRYYVLPPLTLENSSQKWTHSFPVDKCDIFTVTIFATDPKSFTLKFLSPDGEKVANETYDESIGYGPGGSYPCRTYLFEDPISVGEWHITVTSDHSFYPVNIGLIASFYPSDLILQAFVPTENLIVGKSIDIIALLPMSIGLQKTSNSTLSIATLENAITKIYLPDGNEERIKLEEGPSHSIRNVKRGNGVRSLYASFEVKEAGMYKSLVEVSGKLSDGTNFIRSLWYVFTIAHPSINITGNVKGSLHTHNISQRDKIDFDIDVNWDESDLSYRAFAQVWSTGENKEDVIIAWISGLVDVQKREDCLSDCYYIHMELDSRWLELANVRQPLVLTLKSVTLEELRAYITLTRSDALVVTADDKLMKWSPSLRAKDIKIDWEMKEGYNPYRVKMHNVTETGKLLLLHGFCAGCNNPFQLEYFDDYILFEDHNKNYLHDEYARKVYDHIMDKGATRLSVYGHSQGGAVALHLYTYYFTAVDASVRSQLAYTI